MPIHLAVVHSEARHGDKECKRPDRTVFPGQVDVEALGPHVQVGKNKTRQDAPRCNVFFHGLPMKILFHLLVDFFRKSNAMYVSYFEWGEVVRINTERQKPQRLFIVIFNFQPNRLNAFLV